MLAASSKVIESPNDSTAAMTHFFTNSPSLKDLEFFAMKFDIAYDAIRAFIEH